MSSSFINKVSREAAEAAVVPGQAEADQLLRRCRQRIYHWPVEFPGFRADLILRDGRQAWRGHFRCAGSRALEIELLPETDPRWWRFQLEELVSHREAPENSRMASRTGCALGDWDPVYGRRIDFLGDKMESFYRIMDDRLSQIGRSYGKERFIINIDAHQECQGRWAAGFYSAYYWSREAGTLSKTETYRDRYHPVDGVFLPGERRISEATSHGLRVRSLEFENLRLL